MNDHIEVRRALLSVSDKTGLIEFAKVLASLGIELISTGGTASALREAGLKVISVEEVTGSPEMLGGRVKTLHPKVHGGILARREIDGPTLALHHITPIDLVCVNLYPFEQTVAKLGVSVSEAIEQIDIGGPSMIRSAAKNAAWVTVVTDPQQYDTVIAELSANASHTSAALRRSLAVQAFARTSQYDAAINTYLQQAASSEPAAPASTEETDSNPASVFPAIIRPNWHKREDLRYGENPHQSAAIYIDPQSTGPSVIGAQQLHGKPLSYNNVLDAAAALTLVTDLTRLEPKLASAVVVKHTNPCGTSLAHSLSDALMAAISGDPLAAFGGIVALNKTIDAATATQLCAQGAFFEVVVAPGFNPDALSMLKDRFANIRLLSTGSLHTPLSERVQIRTVPGGALAQTVDDHIADPSQWVHAAGPAPTAQHLQAAAMLDTVARALTSNAVCIGRAHTDGTLSLAGAGAGQMDRVASCQLAVSKAGEHARGGIAASDAFFPFPDGPAVLIDAGVTMIVHPGGSKRDDQTFDLCNARGVTCMTTGIRRFRH